MVRFVRVQLAAATSPFPFLAAFGSVTWGERPGAKTRVRGIDLAAGTGAWAIGFQAWEGTRENPAATTNSWWDASSFGFTGREHDLDSALVYARDRYLASDTGRWTQADRLGFDAGPNFFAYVNARPTRLVDPSGQLPFLMLPIFGAAIGGIFGLLGGLAQGGLSTGQLVQEFISGAMFGAAATIDVVAKLVPWLKAPIITGAITNALFAALGTVAAQVIATGSVQSWPSVIISALFAAGTTMLMGMSRFGLRDAARMMSSDLQLPFTVRDMFTLIPAKGAAMFDFMVQALLVPAFYYQEQSARIDAMFREGDLACLPG